MTTNVTISRAGPGGFINTRRAAHLGTGVRGMGPNNLEGPAQPGMDTYKHMKIAWGDTRRASSHCLTLSPSDT